MKKLPVALAVAGILLTPMVMAKTVNTVAFHDTSADTYFVVGSTIKTDRTIELEGKVLPYVPLDVSSASHAYYTGKQKDFAKEGSAHRFNQRFGRFFTSSSDK